LFTELEENCREGADYNARDLGTPPR